MEVKEEQLDVPWGHIAAKVYGPQNEKKILMVHGIMDNAGSFDRLLNHLPQDYHYVCIDLPGHGLSSAFPSGTPLNFWDYIHSIFLVLDTLQWKTCTYVGHSLGAQLGIYFSILYPQRIEKIIAVDGFLPYLVDNNISYIQEIYNLNSYAKDSKALYTKDEAIYSLKCRRQESLTTEAAEALFRRAVTKVGDLYKYNRDTRLRMVFRPIFTIRQHMEFLENFSTRMLVIIADSSSRFYLLSEMLELTKSIMKENEVSKVMVRGNHDVHNNYPERVAPHMCKFLRNELQSKL